MTTCLQLSMVTIFIEIKVVCFYSSVVPFFYYSALPARGTVLHYNSKEKSLFIRIFLFY